MTKYSIIDGSKRYLRNLKKLLKKYKLSEPYYQNLINPLKSNPKLGNSIIGFNDLRKLYIKIPDNASRRDGSRLIYSVVESTRKVVLLEIYPKSDKEDLSRDELKKLIIELKKIRDSKK